MMTRKSSGQPWQNLRLEDRSESMILSLVGAPTPPPHVIHSRVGPDNAAERGLPWLPDSREEDGDVMIWFVWKGIKEKKN